MTHTGTEHGLGVDIRHDVPDAYRALAALTRSVRGLDHRLAELVKVRVSQINGCAYCVDLHVDLARKAGESDRRLHALAVWNESPFFDARERTALALAEALTVPPLGPVDQEVADAARELDRDELELLIVAITGINAWNRAMVASGTPPPPLEEPVPTEETP
jgi:AhpD family alkylhydroperoxidase